MRIAHYGNTRYWAVYDGAMLVCVCVYKRGALEVLRRLQARDRQNRKAMGLPGVGSSLW